jgi:aerobic-type carbon monoxide dehydrogenase small subunit (CoxS/CutS family)
MPTFSLQVNGRVHEVIAEPADSLLTVLREDLGLTGSKFGCGEGFCGACTVLIDGQAVRSCVTRVGTLEGKSITTIEGITGERLHPVQQAFLETEALQCGYCTPGMIMAAIGLLQSNPDPTPDEVARAMDRNVCRCGTYARIVSAVQLAAKQGVATQAAEGPGGNHERA